MSAFKKKKLPPKVENMTKEEVIYFLKKKRDCEAVAQSIVVTLLENKVSEDTFIQSLRFIAQSHYDDITEERAITKVCGYPLCSKMLSDKLPSQQFMISCKTNQVYDITARKNFCSNVCYKASVFIKEQILPSPLWCRDKKNIPNFQLMSRDTKGIPGEVVDLTLVKKIETDEIKDSGFSSYLDFTEASLSQMDIEGKKVNLESVEVEDQAMEEEEKDKVFDLDGEVAMDVGEPEVSVKPVEKKVDDTKSKKKPLMPSGKILGEIVERKPENRIDPIISAGQKMQDVEDGKNAVIRKDNLVKQVERRKEMFFKPKKVKKEPKPLSAAIVHIEKCLGEWFSLETMLFLFGDVRVKQMVSDKGESIKVYLNNVANGLLYKSTSYDQYQLLCRKLNLLELEDRKFDSKVTSAKELKPLPHYSMLQEESERLDIKVRAFLKGDMEMPIKKEAKINNETITIEDNDEKTTNLPLVDKTAQHALRRKIVLNSLNRVLPDLLQSLGLSSREVSSDVRLLVATFNLQAHNIVFKPAQWSMIVMIFIKLLSIRDGKLKHALEQDRANTHLQLLLMSYQQDGGYLDRFILWLTDIDRLLDTNVLHNSTVPT